MTILIFFALLGYLIGTIPFGLLLTRLAGYGDIRTIGSGNIGATNVLRTGNKGLAALTLLLDGGKGAVAVLLAQQSGSADAALLAGLFCIGGHCFPVWLKFKGGKGVATTLGMFLALAPTVGVCACAVWLATAALFRYSSLAALLALLSTPFMAFLIYQDAQLAAASLAVAAFVWYRHKTNIERLLKGEEPKIGKKKYA